MSDKHIVKPGDTIRWSDEMMQSNSWNGSFIAEYFKILAFADEQDITGEITDLSQNSKVISARIILDKRWGPDGRVWMRLKIWDGIPKWGSVPAFTLVKRGNIAEYNSICPYCSAPAYI